MDTSYQGRDLATRVFLAGLAGYPVALGTLAEWLYGKSVTGSCQSLPDFPAPACRDSCTRRSRVAIFAGTPPLNIPNLF